MLGKKTETYFYNAKEKIFYPRPGCSNRIGGKWIELKKYYKVKLTVSIC